MTVPAQQRPFTAEIRKGSREFPVADDVADDARSRHHELMQALDDIRRRLDGFTQPAAVVAETCGLDPARLLGELQALEGAIAETKREIAALRQLGKPPTSIATTTNELDAVVQATESATECILAASERIDALVLQLRNQAADAEERAGIDEIGEQVTRIFESCNFQDITGQRITKVVNAMKFIEERVERMIEILGGAQAFAGIESVSAPSAANAAPDDSDLLCGPQLDQHKISQDAIDAFFD
jgi:chemotaxis protein CheZ